MKRIHLIMFAVILAVATAGMAASNDVMAQTADSDPSGLRAWWHQGLNGVFLHWTPSPNPAYVGQIALGKEVGGTSWTMESTVQSPTTNAEVIGSVEQGNTYVFVVAGLTSTDPRVYGGYSNEVTVTIPRSEGQQAPPEPAPEPSPEPAPEPPTQSTPAERNPSALSATSADGSVTLTWVPGTNPKFAKQAIKRREARRGSKWTTIELDVAATTYTDTDVLVGTRYIYRVQGLKSNNKVAGVSRPVKITAR